jgi:hypothetical protein
VIEGIESKPENVGCADNAQLLLKRMRKDAVESSR